MSISEQVLNVDPVCKMKITTTESVGESIFHGVKYYFCSRDCKELFESDPRRYLDTKVADVKKEEGLLSKIAWRIISAVKRQEK